MSEGLSFTHEKHLTGVAVVAIFDNGDIDINDVAVFQLFVGRNTVADAMVHRGADGFWESAVIERCRNRILFVDDVVMANAV